MKTTILAALLLSTASAFCQAKPVHIDFTQPLKGIDGKPLKASTDKDSLNLTLGDVAAGALESPIGDTPQTSGLEKFKRDELARRIYGKKDVALTLDEITQIRDRIGLADPPYLIGAAWPLLDATAGK
jgi:hypothetical protein